MGVAIISGPGFYKLQSGRITAQTIDTPYGQALVFLGGDEAGEYLGISQEFL